MPGGGSTCDSPSGTDVVTTGGACSVEAEAAAEAAATKPAIAAAFLCLLRRMAALALAKSCVAL